MDYGAAFRVVGPSRTMDNSNRGFKQVPHQFHRFGGPILLPRVERPAQQIIGRRIGVVGNPIFRNQPVDVNQFQARPSGITVLGSDELSSPSLLKEHANIQIDVGLLAQYAENAINLCAIVMNTQMWFEAIMMTFGENMSVVDAATMNNVDFIVLFRLMNMVRTSLRLPQLNSARQRQFSWEDTVDDGSTLRKVTVRRVIRVLPRKDSLTQHFPESSDENLMPSNESARGNTPTTKSSHVHPQSSEAEAPIQSVLSHQSTERWTPMSGRDEMRKTLEQIKCSSISEEEVATVADADEKMRNDEALLALDLASIATTRSVLKEKKRREFNGTYEDLVKYFHDRLIQHKQCASPSIVRALSHFVANNKSNFGVVAEMEAVNRKLMRTMLRLALFDRRFEIAKIPFEYENMDIEPKKDDEEMETSEEWLHAMVAELSVPITVLDFTTVLDLAEKKMDRACLKALYRHVAPLVESDTQMRIGVERLIMDGYNVASGVPEIVFKLWSARMERMLMCLMREYPVYLERWRSMAEVHHSEETTKERRKRRESKRIKAQSAVPDSLYLDKIFNRELKKSFINFLKKVKSSGMPMSESTVVSIGEKILSFFEEKRSIKKQSWSEWVNLVLGVEANSLFEYLHSED